MILDPVLWDVLFSSDTFSGMMVHISYMPPQVRSHNEKCASSMCQFDGARLPGIMYLWLNDGDGGDMEKQGSLGPMNTPRDLWCHGGGWLGGEARDVHTPPQALVSPLKTHGCRCSAIGSDPWLHDCEASWM